MPTRPVILKWRDGRTTRTHADIEFVAAHLTRVDDSGMLHRFRATDEYEGEAQIYVETKEEWTSS